MDGDVSGASDEILVDPLVFPNIRRMLIRMMVLPVTSCEAERWFSTSRRVKTYIRSTMIQDKSSGLALMNVHAESFCIPTTQQVRDKFLSKNRRLMEEALL